MDPKTTVSKLVILLYSYIGKHVIPSTKLLLYTPVHCLPSAISVVWNTVQKHVFLSMKIRMLLVHRSVPGVSLNSLQCCNFAYALRLDGALVSASSARAAPQHLERIQKYTRYVI